MNSYKPSTPRVAVGLTAVAMTAITMGVLVVLPAKFGSASADPYTLAAAKGATTAPIELAASPARVDAPVVVNREEQVHLGRTTFEAPESAGNVTN
jgi:hypothetical protein